MTLTTLLGAAVRREPVSDEPVRDAVFERRWKRGMIEASRRHAKLSLEGIADFEIKDGTVVVLDPARDAHEPEVEAYLFATVSALLLGQQGRFALHAGVVSIGDSTVAIAGHRGAGKSTTGLCLAQRGHRICTDDITPVEVQDGVAIYEPTPRPIHVWAETADALGVDVSSAVELGDGSTKLVLPKTASTERGRLDAVVVLREGECEAPRLRHVQPTDAVPRLISNIYRPKMIRRLWPQQAFKWAARLADAVPMYVVERPSEGWTVETVADLAEQVALTMKDRPG